MHIFESLNDYTPHLTRPLILGIGNFDGVHLAHQKLLAHVVKKAQESGGSAAVFTFRDHPQKILNPSNLNLKLLMSLNHRLATLKRLQMDACFLMHFTEAFSRIEPECFVEDILLNRLKVQTVVMGYNARFGLGRRGDAAMMKQLAKQKNFSFMAIDPVELANDVISSSRIRGEIAMGNLQLANQCLGRPFSIWAPVTRGNQMGKPLGYPTANLDIANQLMPQEGVYAVMTRVVDVSFHEISATSSKMQSIDTGKWFQGALNYGKRPTLPGQMMEQAVAEVFLLDYEGDLYGKTLEIVFVRKLRDEKRFKNGDLLRQQIQKDVLAARKCLKSGGEEELYKLG